MWNLPSKERCIMHIAIKQSEKGLASGSSKWRHHYAAVAAFQGSSLCWQVIWMVFWWANNTPALRPMVSADSIVRRRQLETERDSSVTAFVVGQLTLSTLVLKLKNKLKSLGKFWNLCMCSYISNYYELIMNYFQKLVNFFRRRSS